jgi:hypothetical protein
LSGIIDKLKSLFSRGGDKPGAASAAPRRDEPPTVEIERERAPDTEFDPSGGGKRGFGDSDDEEEPERQG